MAGCPEPDTLLDFLEERLSPADVAALREHLAGCPICPQVLAQAARADPARQSTSPAHGPARKPARLTFAIDEVVAGRYRILRFLAQGGMGQVYQAHDQELRIDVALKAISPQISDDAQVLARFKREVLLARRVSHDNVCRIYDLGVHRLQGPEVARSIHFLTMELLEGCTLAQRLRTRGPLPAGEALPLIQQMAQALEAAHRQGVVHRDFKPDNIFLVAGEGGVERLVVTDFGLAQTRIKLDAEEGARSAKGALIGTPAYMAPEQVRGEQVGPAADLYALGVVIYETVSGARPFVGDTPLAVALRRLTEKPISPRAQRPGLDARWERTILRCLAKEPEARFGSALEVRRALEDRPIGRWGRRMVPGAVVLVALLVAAGASVGIKGWRDQAAPRSASEAVVKKLRRSVAILGFKNSAGRPDEAWLSTALVEMLGTEMAAGEQLRVLSGENVAQMKSDPALKEAESYARETLARVRAHLGTDLVVGGSYVAQGKEGGGRLRLDLRLQDAVTGETLLSAADSGDETDLFELVSRSGARLRARLGQTPGVEVAGVRATLPSAPEATRLYAEGWRNRGGTTTRLPRDCWSGRWLWIPRARSYTTCCRGFSISWSSV